MNVEILERLMIAVALAGLGVTFYLLFNRFTLKRAESKVARFASYRPGLPALVYFTTPTCAPCKTVQRPAIERIKSKMGAWFQVIEVDASAAPQVAQEWGVMSVPTTFIIDANGKPRYVNHGVTNAETLIKQLELEDFSI
jgi:thiol-disulfide isomerase/thioredoxin